LSALGLGVDWYSFTINGTGRCYAGRGSQGREQTNAGVETQYLCGLCDRKCVAPSRSLRQRSNNSIGGVSSDQSIRRRLSARVERERCMVRFESEAWCAACWP
jgi:hypothetical protein